jgi:dethiobiotin synthetase
VTRPTQLVVVTGTGTSVGKTWVGARVLARLRTLGQRVAARKPVQSFEPNAGPTDADLLADATGEYPDQVCASHRWYELALAPPMAAAALGRPPIALADLVAEVSWPAAVDVGLVEGVGGPRSPLAADGDTVDLVRLLRPDVVALVAESGLGAINAVRLAAAPFLGLTRVVVVLNRFEPDVSLHTANRQWLAGGGLDVVVGPAGLAERLGSATDPLLPR